MRLNRKCALVIGASSGIGEAAARHFARRGYRIALVSRRLNDLEQIARKINERAGSEVAFPFCHDVTDYGSVPALLETIFDKLGGLSHVVYASGVLETFAPDEFSFEKDLRMMEVNLIGMIAWFNPVADMFQRLKEGVIIGVGSIAGDRGRKGNPCYNTSKGAQAIYLEALRNRLAASHIRVVTIKPGFVETAMTAGMGNLLWMISADEAGRRVVNAAETAEGTIYIPRRWRLVSIIIRSIPSFIFKKLDI